VRQIRKGLMSKDGGMLLVSDALPPGQPGFEPVRAFFPRAFLVAPFMPRAARFLPLRGCPGVFPFGIGTGRLSKFGFAVRC